MFRLLVPTSLGGDDSELLPTLTLLEALARGDASTAWVAMQGHHCATLPTRLPASSYASIYANGPDVIWANSMIPAGRAERVDGGYRVSGRWPFVSGCLHADWIYALCIETENGQPTVGPVPDHPPIIGVVAPAAAWTFEDSWHASGLRGTGSHHASLSDRFVEATWTFSLFGAPNFPGPAQEFGLTLLTLQFAAIAVGTAQGAIDDLAALATSGKQYSFAREPLRDSPVFHHEVGRIEAELKAARALLYAQAVSLWERATLRQLDDADAVEAAQCRTWIAAASARVVDACHALGGSSVVTDDSPLQRRLRDVHAITQHLTLNPRQYAFAGAVVAGHPPRNPVG
jgi:alkylation response protein AidB-like acyl-CoA dehydrogenase